MDNWPEAKWISTGEFDISYAKIYKCNFKTISRSNYCPDCGCKMDKKEYAIWIGKMGLNDVGFVCSNCKKTNPIAGDICPNCGIKMEEDNE